MTFPAPDVKSFVSLKQVETVVEFASDDEGHQAYFPGSVGSEKEPRSYCCPRRPKCGANLRGFLEGRIRGIQEERPQIPPAFPLPPEEGRLTAITSEPAMPLGGKERMHSKGNE